MTKEELIRYGKDYLHDLETACCSISDIHKEFVRESIKALEQQPCDDCVSREQAIEFVNEAIGGNNDFAEAIRDGVEAVLSVLPPVTPTQTETVSKETYDQEYFARKEAEQKLWELQQNTSNDCVSRKAVAEIINKQRFGIHQISMGIIKEKIESLPPVTPTRKVGKWEKNEHTFWTCSECGLVNKYNRIQYAYCPNCGAEMRGSENDTKTSYKGI